AAGRTGDVRAQSPGRPRRRDLQRAERARLMAAWPEVVWDAPVLRALDPRARSEIQASGRVRSLSAGEVLYRAGDPADALFVVAAGACTLHGVRRGEVQPTLIRRARSGETFGEDATAFAFSTRQLEARSETSTTVAEVPAVVLKRAIG